MFRPEVASFNPYNPQQQSDAKRAENNAARGNKVRAILSIRFL
jgi:hypothetical protein